MKRWLGYSLLALVAYGIFLFIQLPVPVLVDLASQRIPGLAVREVEGSVLSGSARNIEIQESRLESITWQLRFLPFFLGRLEYRFNLADTPTTRLQGITGVGLDRQLHISELTGRLPLPQVISLAGHPPPPVNGEVQVNLTGLQIDNHGMPQTAYGTVQLRGIHTSFGRSLELGDFSAELDTKATNIVGNIKDTGGPLELAATLTLTPQGDYRLNGQVAVRTNNPELSQALTILMGQPNNGGQWRISLTGVL